MYILTSFLDSITHQIDDAYRSFCYSISADIYGLISKIYDLFDRMSTAEILSSDIIQQIYTRVGLILVIYMLFRLTFSFIQMLVDPDRISDKEKGLGNIIKKAVLTVVLLGVTPTIFEAAFDLQNLVMGKTDNTENLISKVILPYTAEGGDFGSTLSSTLFMSFYYPLESSEIQESDDYSRCQTNYKVLQNEIMDNNTFDTGYNCLNTPVEMETSSLGGEDDKTYSYLMNFNPFFSLVAGIFVIWILLSYTISVGIRVIQLAFLQLIAPIPIMSYMSPKKDGMFEKWGKICLSTYLDLFIRVAIIDFVVVIIQGIMSTSGISVFEQSVQLNSAGVAASSSEIRFLYIILILALLMFAKKAPDLLKELFPKSAGSIGFGLGLPSPFGKAVAGALGFASGAAVGAFGGKGIGRVTGALRGAVGGAAIGLKSKGDLGSIGKSVLDSGKAQSGRNKDINNVLASGGSRSGYRWSKIQRTLGSTTAGDRQKIKADSLKNYANYREGIRSVADSNGTVSRLKREYESAKASGLGTQEVNARFSTYISARDSAVSAAMKGNAIFDYNTTYVDANGATQKVGTHVDTKGGLSAGAISQIGSFTAAANAVRPASAGEITDASSLSSAHDAAEVEYQNLVNSPLYQRNQANNPK